MKTAETVHIGKGPKDISRIAHGANAKNTTQTNT
jgi:hypothetical protein